MTTLADIPDRITNLRITDIGKTTVDFEFQDGGGVTPKSYKVYINGSVWSNVSISRHTINTGTVSGLTKGTTYTLGVSACGSDGCSYIVTSPQFETENRPSDWVFSSLIASNQEFKMTAIEWNGFTQRINDFRVYTNRAAYSFTQAISGGYFTYTMYNQALTAINGMSPPTPVGVSSKSRFDVVYASHIWALAQSLNSIT